MKSKITIAIRFVLIILAFCTFETTKATVPNPIIISNPTTLAIDKTVTWTFDFTGNTKTSNTANFFTEGEDLVIYFWDPAQHASVALTYLGSSKWSFTMTPTTFFNLTFSQIALSANQFWFNIQSLTTGSNNLTGSLHMAFGAQSTTAPVSVTGTPSGTYPLNQPVTWTFDMTGSAFTPAQDLYIWVWTPNNPDAGNFANSSAFTKLTYVSGMTWSFTLTPTAFFNTTVSGITDSFWMLLKDKTGKIQTPTINVPLTISGTGVHQNQQNFLEVYPNPVINTLNIKLKDTRFKNASIYDFKGSLVRNEAIVNVQSELKLNLENEKSGIYFVVLSGEKSTQTIKISKK
jgi:hypothetical protein